MQEPTTSTEHSADVIRRLAIALSVSANLLLFGKDERGRTMSSAL